MADIFSSLDSNEWSVLYENRYACKMFCNKTDGVVVLYRTRLATPAVTMVMDLFYLVERMIKESLITKCITSMQVTSNKETFTHQSLIPCFVVTDKWDLKACRGPKPPPRKYHAACSFGKFMYVNGGQTEDGESDELFVLDCSMYKRSV